MSIYPVIRMVFLSFATMAFNAVKGQHYLFIEADGQKPFYVKKGTTMISSSASGFLIIPRITAPEIELTIGFPKNTHPEVSFYINGTDRDRGFQLKMMEGQGWSLFDRTSLEFIKAGSAAPGPVQLHIVKKDEGGFASLLSVATDDKSLSLPGVPKNNADQSSTVKEVVKPTKTIVSVQNGLKDSAAAVQVRFPTTTSSTQMDNEALKPSVFVEKSLPANPDTIVVEIEKSNSIPSDTNGTKQLGPSSSGKQAVTGEGATTNANAPVLATVVADQKPVDTPAQANKTNPVAVCDRPFGDNKDLRSLQKKLLGLAAVEDQLNYAVKVFSQKCFNTKQALEIGWFFVDEKNRLKLLTLLKPLVSNPFIFSELEGSFLKEENINDFRALISGSN